MDFESLERLADAMCGMANVDTVLNGSTEKRAKWADVCTATHIAHEKNIALVARVAGGVEIAAAGAAFTSAVFTIEEATYMHTWALHHAPRSLAHLPTSSRQI